MNMRSGNTLRLASDAAILVAAALAIGVLALPMLRGAPELSAVDVAAIEEFPPASVTRAIAPAPDLDPQIVDLGARLFDDPILSRDGVFACSSCHLPAFGGASGLARDVGRNGEPLPRHTSSSFNMADQSVFFWDGRADSLDAVVDDVVLSAREFDTTWPALLGRVAAEPVYAALFAELFPEQGVSRETVLAALNAFQLSLQTLDAPFDLWLRGDPDAMSASAARGWREFVALGCVSCHQGAALGGNMRQKFGLFDREAFARTPYAIDDARPMETAPVFKVPSLRNVAETAPYFHNGSAETLEEAVTVMARYQLGAELRADELADIVAFLEALSAAPAQ